MVSASDRAATAHSPERELTPVGGATNLEVEDIGVNPERSDESVPQVVSHPESIELSDSETDEERGDDMMLTLKSEIEEAKAEEDLNLLKEEALQSAMVTASNLT